MTTSNFPIMHVSVYVNSIGETVNFYSSFFGKPANKIKLGYAKYVLNSPSLIISFVENPERVSSSFGHLGIQSRDAGGTASKVGFGRVFLRKEIGTACCYAVQDKFWVNDPDGYQWEAYYFHAGAEFNDPKYEQPEETNCCIATPDTEESNLNVIQTEKPARRVVRLAQGIVNCFTLQDCCKSLV